MSATILNFPSQAIDVSAEAARCGIDCPVAATPRVWFALQADPSEPGADRRWRALHELLAGGSLTARAVGGRVLIDFAA